MSAQLEVALLGAILDAENHGSNAAALLDMSGLRGSDMTDLRVKTAWQIVESLVRRRRPVDALTVYSAGMAARLLAEADAEWLRDVQSTNVVDREKFATVAEQLRTTNRTQRAARLIREALESLTTGADPGSVFASIEGTCADAAREGYVDGTGDEDIYALSEQMSRAESNDAPVLLPTGIDAIDEVIRGFPPNLTVICGLPSVGKSALLGTIIDNQLRMGFKVGLFGLEDGTLWLPKRLIARDIGVPVRDVVGTKLQPEQAAKFQESANEYANRLKNLIVYRQESINSEEMARRAVDWIVNKGVRCIYVDHMGEVEHLRRSETDDQRRLAVAWSYRRLRNIGIKYGVPVVALAHTNRESAGKFGEEPRPPRLNEIAESREIEGMARLALGLWLGNNEPGFMRCTVLKQTEGERDVHIRLKRLTTSALVDAKEGERFSPFAEQMAKAREAKKQRDAEKSEERKRREEAKAIEKAKLVQERARAKAQASMLDEGEAA